MGEGRATAAAKTGARKHNDSHARPLHDVRRADEDGRHIGGGIWRRQPHSRRRRDSVSQHPARTQPDVGIVHALLHMVMLARGCGMSIGTFRLMRSAAPPYGPPLSSKRAPNAV